MDSHQATQFKCPDFFLAYPFSESSGFDMEDLRRLFDGIDRIDHRIHQFNKGYTPLSGCRHFIRVTEW
jgi:hypothetical protein